MYCLIWEIPKSPGLPLSSFEWTDADGMVGLPSEVSSVQNSSLIPFKQKPASKGRQMLCLILQLSLVIRFHTCLSNIHVTKGNIIMLCANLLNFL